MDSPPQSQSKEIRKITPGDVQNEILQVCLEAGMRSDQLLILHRMLREAKNPEAALEAVLRAVKDTRGKTKVSLLAYFIASD